jgi:hypothetical protein
MRGAGVWCELIHTAAVNDLSDRSHVVSLTMPERSDKVETINLYVTWRII